jgi:hypothetical protein
MSILLLAGLLASVITLVTVFVLCLRRQFRLAGRIVFRWVAGAVAYAAISLLTAMLPNASALKTGVPYCDDDMCMSVQSSAPHPAAPESLTALPYASSPAPTREQEALARRGKTSGAYSTQT